jgi:hypothetical protein
MKYFIIQLAFMLLVGLLLTACGTQGYAISSPSDDMRRWLTYRVEIGDQILQFTIPPGVNGDFLDSPTIPKRIDPQQDETFDKSGSAEIFTRHWDYREGSFSPVVGTLVASIGLGYSQSSLDSLSDLQEEITRDRDLIQQQTIARDPRFRGPSTSPIRFDHVRIAERDALFISYRVLPPNYAVKLDVHHYLTISIRNGVNPGVSREKAQIAADAILRSISIEPKH